MHRFFVPASWVEGDSVTLRPPVAHQVGHVLRLRPGAHVVVLDDSGWEYETEITFVRPDLVCGTIRERRLSLSEPGIALVLYQGLLKGEKMDWVFQKGTEVGVSRFVPLVTERTIPRLAQDAARPRLARWQAIAREAAEQSARGRLPSVVAPISLEGACAGLSGPALLLWEDERATGLRHALEARDIHGGEAVRSLSLFVGPEGGFTSQEVALAQQWGVQPVSLGRRILRAETAGVVAAALVLYHFQELGNPP